MAYVIHVDNSGFFRKIMRAYLRELGFESEEFQLGKDALFAAQGGNVSCVITALELSDMKGEDFIEQLAVLDQKIPIIVFSATADKHRTEFLETRGVVGIVQKTSNWKDDLRRFFL